MPKTGSGPRPGAENSDRCDTILKIGSVIRCGILVAGPEGGLQRLVNRQVRRVTGAFSTNNY
jgi:hypothetical protein